MIFAKTIVTPFRLIILALAIVLVSILIPQSLNARAYTDWWQSDWQYRIPIDITENAGDNLTDYPVVILLNTSSFDYGKTEANGNDLRFIADSAVCDYWIETWNSTGESKIWVEIPAIPASGNTTLDMYYGNPAASSTSTGDVTFDFFDDFEDGDISDWSQYGSGTVQIASDNGNYVLLKTANNDPYGGYSPFNNGAISDFEAIIKTKRINENGGHQNRYGIEDSNFNGYGPRMYDFDSLPASFTIEKRSAGSTGGNLVTKSTSAYQWDTWMTVEFRKYGSVLEFELYDSSGSLVESITTSNSQYNSFDRFVVHGGWEYYTDDVIVRRYVNPEPTVSLGEEYQQAVADFTATPTSGIAPLSVNFTDSSTGSITGWYWDFGDGDNSTLQNPSHTYDSPGVYTVSLTVSGPGGTDNETKADYITVYQQAVADFTATPTSGIAPLSVNFTDSSTGSITGWYWDFGDGDNSTLQNPPHTYDSPGVYTVSLTVSGPGGTDNVTKADYITVYQQAVADFTATPTEGIDTLTVDFTDNSTGNITGWYWDFGDGKNSTLQNPSHTYESPGVYTVNLTVSGPGGTDNETKADYIVVWDIQTYIEFYGIQEEYIDIPEEPASFASDDPVISADQVYPDQPVDVSLTITNSGDITGRQTVNLILNGQIEQTQTVSVQPGGHQVVTFTIKKSTPGTYDIYIGDLYYQLIVIETTENTPPKSDVTPSTPAVNTPEPEADLPIPEDNNLEPETSPPSLEDNTPAEVGQMGTSTTIIITIIGAIVIIGIIATYFIAPQVYTKQ